MHSLHLNIRNFSTYTACRRSAPNLNKLIQIINVENIKLPLVNTRPISSSRAERTGSR